MTPQSTMKSAESVERNQIPLFFPTLKLPAQARYRLPPDSRYAPLTCVWEYRLCEIGTVDLQRFVLQKMEGHEDVVCGGRRRSVQVQMTAQGVKR